jgi:hypothetical protein
MWKKMSVTYFKVLSRRFLLKFTDILCQYDRQPGREFDLLHPGKREEVINLKIDIP